MLAGSLDTQLCSCRWSGCRTRGVLPCTMCNVIVSTEYLLLLQSARGPGRDELGRSSNDRHPAEMSCLERARWKFESVGWPPPFRLSS